MIQSLFLFCSKKQCLGILHKVSKLSQLAKDAKREDEVSNGLKREKEIHM